MGLAEIEKQILKEAETAAKKIRFENKEELGRLDKLHQENLARLKKASEHEATALAERASREVLVPARQKAKKALLEEKQRILSALYTDIQNEKKLANAEIARVREESEVNVGKLLFK